MRILFIALPESIHTARWIRQLQNKNWDLHLFPTSEALPHPLLQNVTIHKLFTHTPHTINADLRQTGLKWPLQRGKSRIETTLERYPLGLNRAARLAHLVRKLKPDAIHVLEMQRAGYLTLASREGFSSVANYPALIYSSWGNDLFHFGKQSDHEPRIRRFLSFCDYYIADCERDIPLAKKYGFRGEVLGVFPTGGGFDIDSLRQLGDNSPTSTRKVIAVKGYDGGEWGGRASVALNAIRQCLDLLQEFEIVVYSSSPGLQQWFETLPKAAQSRFTFPSHMDHSEIIRLFGRARLAIGVNTTDGTPNSMIEAMALGAFPIQSDTISTREWITDGANGFLVPPEDPATIEKAIRRAVFDDTLVDSAAAINYRMARDRVDYSIIQPQVISMYEKVFANTSNVAALHRVN